MTSDQDPFPPDYSVSEIFRAPYLSDMVMFAERVEGAVTKYEAGPALDALIAEKVLGCKLVQKGAYAKWYECGCVSTDPYHHPPHADPHSMVSAVIAEYSTDIGAAWQVVRLLHDTGWELSLEDRHGNWICEFSRDALEGLGPYGFVRQASDFAPLSICLAALEVIGA